jgi:L-malate glycosyltransferase
VSRPVRRPRARVLILQETLRRYREAFYEHLRDDLRTRGTELALLHGQPALDASYGDQGSLEWTVEVPVRRAVVPGSGREVVWHSGFRHARHADLVVVEQKASSLVNYPLLLGQGRRGPRVALWGHGRTWRYEHSGRAERTVGRWMAGRPHWWFAYTEEGAEFVAAEGFPRDRITVVRNSTDTRSLIRQMEGLREQHVRELAAQLGFEGTQVALHLGSLRHGRRLGFLIEAADEIRRKVPDFELVFVGSGPVSSTAVEARRTRPWVHLVGPRFDADLAALLHLARLILVPGSVGLVAVDSLAAGVPLVTSASVTHHPEASYIRDGVTGRIVDDGGDPSVYASVVTGLLLDDALRGRLVRGCLEARHEFSAEAMAARFADGIQQALTS